MTKQILQSLKIFRLATALARWDLLELIDSPTTGIYVLWGKLWQKKSNDTLKSRINGFLEKETDELQKIFVSESGYEYVDFLPLEQLKTEKEISMEEAETYTILFRRLACFCPRLRTALPIFISRIDIARDKRLQASETEEYIRLSGKNEKALVYEVDWIKTDKFNLKLELPPQTKIGDELSAESQKALINIWADLFFEEDVLLWNWGEVISNEKNEAGFLSPDCLITIDSAVKNFALKHIQKAQNPQQYLEHKFVVAYNRLKRLCPQIDVAKELTPYCRKRYEKNIKAEEKEDLLANMSNLGFAINTKNKIELTPPSRIKRLQSPKIFGKEKEFRNSSPLLFLLLAAMIYALLKYF